MTTLRQELNARGYGYTSIFTNHAQDILFDDPEELCESLGFIVTHIDRLDYEIPENRHPSDGYAITNGRTSGNYPMKYSSEYRIYFDTTYNMPQKLRDRLQKDNQMRITGSRFVEACSHLGFQHGSYQDLRIIVNNINNIFNRPSEQAAFAQGRRL